MPLLQTNVLWHPGIMRWMLLARTPEEDWVFSQKFGDLFLIKNTRAYHTLRRQCIKHAYHAYIEDFGIESVKYCNASVNK